MKLYREFPKERIYIYHGALGYLILNLNKGRCSSKMVLTLDGIVV